MKSRILTIAVFSLLVAFCCLLFVVSNKKDEKKVSTEIGLGEIELHELRFFDEQLFNKGIRYVSENKEEMEKKDINGGVIPHHLLPSHIIAEFFYRVSLQDVKTVVIVGPNHHELGNSEILTSNMAWETPFGNVDPDLKIIEQLLQEEKAEVQNDILNNEHSIAGLVPFVEYYLPNASIVPLIVKNKIKMDEIDELAKALFFAGNSGETIIVASVDFSHHLDNKEAQKKDKETLDAIENQEYELLMSFENDHLDSPGSLAVLMKTMDYMEINEFDVLHKTNSNILLGDDSVDTTSYLNIIF